jgi:hypothetical protein
MLRPLIALVFLLTTLAHLPAQDAAAPKPDAKAQLEAAQKLVKQLSPGVFDLNGIQITTATRELRIPCDILHQKLPIEYALCHENGEKVHETILETKVKPIQIQLALLLAHYQPATLLAIHVEWKDGDKTKNVPLSDFIQDIDKRKTPPDLDTWIFNGSLIDQSGFVAEQTGSIISTYVDRAAIINSAAKGNQRDDLWISMPANIPPEETKVTLIITPGK